MNPRNSTRILCTLAFEEMTPEEQQRVNAYADEAIRSDKLRGHPAMDSVNERSTDGRSIALDYKGYYTAPRLKQKEDK